MQLSQQQFCAKYKGHGSSIDEVFVIDDNIKLRLLIHRLLTSFSLLTRFVW